jgi:hypothetical protein
MVIELRAVLRKEKRISTPGLKGLSYGEQVALRRELRAHDRCFVDYVLKPATDEMWNLIDARRTVGEIIEYALLEFDLRTEPRLWLPVFVGWGRAGLVSLDRA